MLNKSYITNAVALLLIAVSVPLKDATLSHILLFTGLFAFSGAITNALAIHMLFEKVPFLYGSGVILNRFEAFKASIRTMIMEQFFTQEQIDDFFTTEEQKIDLTPLIEQTDFSPTYEALSSSVMESSFGGMLSMFGGEQSLETLREPFTQKIKESIITITQTPAFNMQLHAILADSSLSSDVQQRIEQLIQQRLEELTPTMVKELVEELIREHLGWLVVWGGVFGGLIGMASAVLL